MDNVKDDTFFADKIRDDLIFIVSHTKNIDEEELSKNEILLDSMMFRLIQISKNAKRKAFTSEFIREGIKFLIDALAYKSGK